MEWFLVNDGIRHLKRIQIRLSSVVVVVVVVVVIVVFVVVVVGGFQS